MHKIVSEYDNSHMHQQPLFAPFVPSWPLPQTKIKGGQSSKRAPSRSAPASAAEIAGAIPPRTPAGSPRGTNQPASSSYSRRPTPLPSIEEIRSAAAQPNIPDQWELRTPLLYCETASSSSEYRLRHNIFDKSGDPFKLASALSRRYTQRADPHHHQHHLISHLAARALASGLTSGRAGQVCTLRRSKPPRQSISLSARIRPGAQGLDGRDRVRGGRTTSSTLSYV